jgi:hypothetical protein
MSSSVSSSPSDSIKSPTSLITTSNQQAGQFFLPLPYTFHPFSEQPVCTFSAKQKCSNFAKALHTPL